MEAGVRRLPGLEKMYLVSWSDDGFVEASLGGFVTAEEIEVLQEELLTVLDCCAALPVNLIVDCSKAKPLDQRAATALYRMSEEVQWAGAMKMVCLYDDPLDAERHTIARLQAVLEGREEYVLELRQASLPKAKRRRSKLAA